MDMDPRSTVTLDSAPDAVPYARRWVGDTLAGTDVEELVPDAELLVSELVTNCIRHAAVDPGATIELKVWPRDSIIRVEVSDPGEGFEPAPVSLSIYSTSGWGLYLVEQIADRWGVQVENGTKVWFEIAA